MLYKADGRLIDYGGVQKFNAPETVVVARSGYLKKRGCRQISVNLIVKFAIVAHTDSHV